MNAHTLTRIADAITLERAREPDNPRGGPGGEPRGKDLVPRTRGAGYHLRDSSLGNVQERRRSGHDALIAESEAMKHRLLKHALFAVCVVLTAVAFHVMTRWP